MLIDPTMQEVLWHFYPKYLDSHTPTERQAKTVHHILNCKTGAYGMNVSKCGKCGHIQYHNNSCRDRACPMCQALSNEMWVDAQNENVLDIDYYHLVFTCPSELKSIDLLQPERTVFSFFPCCDGNNPGAFRRSGTYGSHTWFYQHHAHVGIQSFLPPTYSRCFDQRRIGRGA